MSEEAAFLAVLKANPTDDLTRLVYADWLDENDEPDKARYLRLLCSILVLPVAEIPVSALSDELIDIGKHIDREWIDATDNRFEFALLQYKPDDYYRLFRAMQEVLQPVEETELAVVIGTAPVALRSPLSYGDAFALHEHWQRFSHWFYGAPHIVIRPVPSPYYSPTGLFDVVLTKLPRDFWPNWAFYYKNAISELLGLPTKEAADRVRKLPAVLFAGLRENAIPDTLARIRRAFKENQFEQLPLDAIAVMAHQTAVAT